MNLFSSRGLNLLNLISETKPLGQVNEMISNMRNGTSAGRCLIEF
jgi:D-arabinose 1-dehydrogenase-like Zn-dependent alcohol dehydrogenase